MGTRSKIIVSSKMENTTLVLYKHWDGYPMDNLNMFLEAFKLSVSCEGFSDKCNAYYDRPDMVESRHNVCDRTIFFRDDYPLQGDLEFLYIVDIDEKNIDVFGSGYGTEREHYASGKIHPMSSIDSYREPYKSEHSKKLTEIFNGLNLIGVKINGGEEDYEILKKQLTNQKKTISDLENKVYEIDKEKRELDLRIKFLSKDFFKKMNSSTLKNFLELSGVKIKKITKRKGEGEFNVYLEDNHDFRDSQYRTAWQHINSMAHYLDLDFDIK